MKSLKTLRISSNICFRLLDRSLAPTAGNMALARQNQCKLRCTCCTLEYTLDSTCVTYGVFWQHPGPKVGDSTLQHHPATAPWTTPGVFWRHPGPKVRDLGPGPREVRTPIACSYLRKKEVYYGLLIGCTSWPSKGWLLIRTWHCRLSPFRISISLREKFENQKPNWSFKAAIWAGSQIRLAPGDLLQMEALQPSGHVQRVQLHPELRSVVLQVPIAGCFAMRHWIRAALLVERALRPGCTALMGPLVFLVLRKWMFRDVQTDYFGWQWRMSLQKSAVQ